MTGARSVQEMQAQPTNDEKWQIIADRGQQAAEVMDLVALRGPG